MKKCIKCEIEQSLEFFSRDSSKNDGLCPYCKECRSLMRKNRYRENLEVNREKRRLRRQNNIEEERNNSRENYKKHKAQRRIKRQEYYQKNKKQCNETQKKWQKKNPEKIAGYKKKYYENNKEKVKERAKKCVKKKTRTPEQKIERNRKEREKKQKNGFYKIKCNITSAVSTAIKNFSIEKNKHVSEKLPWTFDQLKSHLEKRMLEGMSWENYGSYWSLDHIIPQSKLPYDSTDHPNFLKCWSLENLRPLPVSTNTKKGDKMQYVFMTGTFDLLHSGHLDILCFAKSLGVKLIVAIDGDERVKKLKGVGRPIQCDTKRKIMLESLWFVDKVFIFDTEEKLLKMLRRIKPYFRVVGSDYFNKEVVGREFSKEVIFFKKTPGYSTTDLIQTIVNKEAERLKFRMR